ncbi:A/G-specific adenine glycosylase [Pseudorhodobacter sp. E13]|uniref:A/G-specific adenine glycosylase n=1 Tax=Pseudorhodobacter sp. E13 TaxID=2487931 RepID=UPI000F8E54BE|nr:A/G-specific adenine glycosylase [Pseudorhodobacter sp. E13]RUS59721.1 A/G-specific adenine glycosylase [Pseudorhodobacter sp. E13]
MRDEAAALISWYDRHARVMPWRCPPHSGARPDPYRIWLSEVMLQQTTVAAVRAYFLRFTERWPTVTALAQAQDAAVMAEWAGLGYYARARNLLKCARAVAQDHAGQFPQSYEGLLTLPGIGPYTAAAVAAIAFDQPATVVDGNVERVMARLFNVQTPLPQAKPELTALASSLTPTDRPGDYAQAVMDLGATICTPRNPACGLCPLRPFCAAQAAGTQADLPRKSPKPEKPTRQGTLWLARHPDGRWLVEQRGPKGLLGGMLGFPGTGWDKSTGAPPVIANWQDMGKVRHTFTHFHADMTVLAATTEAPPDHGMFQAINPDDLPTLMRKAYDLASSTLLPR